MIPPEVSTFLIAMSPLVELRGSIPVALLVYELPPWSAYFFSVAGNLVPVLLIPFWGVMADWFSHRVYWCDRLFAWLFAKTRRDHSEKILRFRDLALAILVAIPLPLTGVWTASLVAFVFGIPFFRAFVSIAVGTLVAGLIVLVLSMGALTI